MLSLLCWAYNYNYQLAKENAENDAKLLNVTIVTPVRERIISTQEIAANIVAQLPFYHQYDQERNFFRGILEKYPQVGSIYLQLDPHFGSPDTLEFFTERSDSSANSLVNSIPAESCLQDARRSGLVHDSEKPYWSEPFECTGNQQILSVYYLPFTLADSLGNTMLSGNVACMLSLDFLQDVIAQTKIGKKGFAFLVSSKGTYLTHPIKEFVLHRNIFNLPEKVFPGDSAYLAEYFMTGQEPVITYPHTPQLCQSLGLSDQNS